MIYIDSIEKGLQVYKALASELRLEIIRLLLVNREMNMNDIAKSLEITNGALTSHVRSLEQAGIINVHSVTGSSSHGNQKLCSLNVDRILIDISGNNKTEISDIYKVEIPVGQYADFDVFPTCGLATDKKLIGELDDPRFFAHPERVDAGILWFTHGYVEYIIPNLIPAGMKFRQITISMEIGSEAPGTSFDWPSDISFLMNDHVIGSWTSPGDFGDKRGIFTPEWWILDLNQYGLLKVLLINETGTYIDGRKVSDFTIDDLSLDNKSNIRFKLQVSSDAENVGGLTIFGSTFGNYNQDIKVRVSYQPI